MTDTTKATAMDTDEARRARCDEIAKRLVRDDVLLCLSTLVYDLTVGRGAPEADSDEAIELWRAPPDYEEACLQEGIILTEGEDGDYRATQDGDEFDTGESDLDDARRAACDYFRVDMSDYESEIFEHWAVSHYLADRIEERGGRIVRDWHGLNVWGRATTGQAIYMDGIMQDIAAEIDSAR